MIHKRDSKTRLSQNQERALTMAKDTRYLSFIHNSWHFDYPVPQRLKKWFRIHRIRHSLNTSDVNQAIKLRDLYLRPVISAETAEEMLKQLHSYLEIAGTDLEQSVGKLKSFINRNKSEKLPTLKEICDYFIKHYHKRNPAPASVSKYNSAISAVCFILNGDTPADSLEKKDILHLRDSLLSAPVGWQKSGIRTAKEGERTINPNTIKDVVRMLNNIFAKAIKDEIIERKDNPSDEIDITEAKTKSKRPPEGKEIELLCNMPMVKSSLFDGESWRMLPVIARYTGCRVTEIALLTAKDIITKSDILCLKVTAFGEHKKLKTASSERLVPVSEKLKPYLDKLLKSHPSGRLFPKCGDFNGKDGNIKRAHYFDKAYNRAAKKVSKDLSFHCWRVYANTHMADAGIDILDRESILGHKSDRIQRVYTADNLQRLKKAIDKIN